MIQLSEEEKKYVDDGQDYLKKNDLRGFFKSQRDSDVPLSSMKNILLYMYEEKGVDIFEHFAIEEMKRFLPFETRMIFEAIREGKKE